MLEAGKKFKIFLIFQNKKFPASHNRKNFPDEKFIKGSPFIFFEVKKFSYCGKQEKKFSQNLKNFTDFGLIFEPKIKYFKFHSGTIEDFEILYSQKQEILIPKCSKLMLFPITRSRFSRLRVALFCDPIMSMETKSLIPRSRDSMFPKCHFGNEFPILRSRLFLFP